MPISYVGVAAGTNSATLPAFQSGDVAICFAFRDGNVTNPTRPTPFTNITNTSDGTSCSVTVGWRRLIYTDTTTGTWTNASRVVVVVYRGCEPFITPVGGGANGAGTTNTVAYNTFTLTRGNTTSWVVGFVGHRSTNTTVDSTAISGMTARGGGVDATAEAHAWDTNGAVATWATQNQAITGTASGWVTRTVELLALPTQVKTVAPMAAAGAAPGRML
jgi:hypothetical protein